MARTTALPKAEIVARYGGGESITALATVYGRSFSTMRENLHRWGAAVRRRGPARTHELDESFFQSIDTESKAYWLGFILADGRVWQTGAGNWVCRVDLAARDATHLQKLATALRSTALVKLGHARKSAYLDLCSRQLCDDLRALECGPEKTGQHGMPALAEALKRHFYRGYFDGDGSLFISSGSWCVDVIGSTKFIREFQQWLMMHVGVSAVRLRRRRCVAAVSSLRYTGSAQVAEIMALLYTDAAVYLDRKHARVSALLASRGLHN